MALHFLIVLALVSGAFAKKHKEAWNGLPILLGVIFGLLGLAIIIGAIFSVRRRLRNKRRLQEEERNKTSHSKKDDEEWSISHHEEHSKGHELYSPLGDNSSNTKPQQIRTPQPTLPK